MARKPLTTTPIDWKASVRWPTHNEAMRCLCDPLTGCFIPGLVLLIPSPTADRFVVAHIGPKSFIDSEATEPALTLATIHTRDNPPIRMRIPNRSVLCYVDQRALTPAFLALTPPDRFKVYKEYTGMVYTDLALSVLDPIEKRRTPSVTTQPGLTT